MSCFFDMATWKKSGSFLFTHLLSLIPLDSQPAEEEDQDVDWERARNPQTRLNGKPKSRGKEMPWESRITEREKHGAEGKNIIYSRSIWRRCV